MIPTTSGLIIPGMVAKQLLIPNKMEAYLGAISRWLMGNPVHAKPPNPTANVSPMIARSLFFVYPTITMNKACEKNPEKKKTFRCARLVIDQFL